MFISPQDIYVKDTLLFALLVETFVFHPIFLLSLLDPNCHQILYQLSDRMYHLMLRTANILYIIYMFQIIILLNKNHES